jgi:hypothetical protein
VEQVDLLRYVVEVLEERGITYMVVGCFASGAYGEPRLTQDIDIVVDLRPDQVEPLCAAFPEEDYYVSREAALNAVVRREQFNIIHPASGNRIDLIIARKDAWGQAQLSRRQRMRVFPDRDVYFARPEDIIISKMAYYREGGSEKHLRDITGIMKVSGEEVDTAYIRQWAEKLGLTEIWQAIVRRLSKKSSA